MSGSRSRRKGHDWEREVAQDLTKVRGREYGTARLLARYLDDKGIDVLSLDDTLDVQCKVGARPPTRDALLEVLSGCREGHTPLVALKWNQGSGRPMVKAWLLPYDIGLQLLGERHEEQETERDDPAAG